MIQPFDTAGESTRESAPTVLSENEGQPTARPTLRHGDEQVASWLDDYRRLRDRIEKSSGTAAGRQGRSAAAELDILRARIANHYTGLVESVARRFVHSGEPMEDLVQEGFLGLLSALNHYDGSKGVKFSTYATHFIAGAMRHCLRDRGKIIKEPAWLHELSGKIGRVTDALTQSLGRAPHAAEIAAALNLKEEAVEEILSTRQIFQVASFESDPRDGGDGEFLGMVDPEKIRSDKLVTLQLPIEDRIVLEASVEKLKALEQKVLYEFFYKDLNQTEIARKLDISCNYVSHILKNSTKKLRRILGEAEVRDRGRHRTVSIVDPATGLYTSAHILGRFDEEISRAARGGYRLAVVVSDIAALPAPGHQRDAFLTACGAAVRSHIRRVDIAGRIPSLDSDEAILVLLPHTGAQACVVQERLRTAFYATAVEHGIAFSLTIGSAIFPDQARAAEALIAIARGEEPPAQELKAA